MASSWLPLSSWLELINQQGGAYWRVQLTAIIGFFMFCALEGVLTRRSIAQRPPPELITDMFHWLLTPVFRNLSRFAVVAFVVLHAALNGKEASLASYAGFGPLSRQPSWLMMCEILVFTDFMSYWSHRLFHTVPWLWRFHAIHHSAKTIRWSTTGRVHPVNELVNYGSGVITCFLLGFPVTVVVAMVPVLAWYAVAAHADWDPELGPLHHILAGPRYHRWHHTRSYEGGNKNFSNVFAFWDRLFGTQYFPADRKPEVFGLDPESDDVPPNFLGQIAYPFWRGARIPAADGGAAQPAGMQPTAARHEPAGVRSTPWSALLNDSNPPSRQS